MKLRDIFNRIAAMANEFHATNPNCNWTAEDRADEEITKVLTTEFGAQYIDEGVASKAFAIKMSWGEVVLKFSLSGVHMPTPEKLEEYPVLRQHFLRPLFSNPWVMVQPRVCMKNAESVSTALKQKFSALYFNSFDAHQNNVGEFRGRMVIFDALVW